MNLVEGIDNGGRVGMSHFIFGSLHGTEICSCFIVGQVFYLMRPAGGYR